MDVYMKNNEHRTLGSAFKSSFRSALSEVVYSLGIGIAMGIYFLRSDK